MTPQPKPWALAYKAFVITIEAKDLVSVRCNGELLGWTSDLATAVQWVDEARYIWGPRSAGP
jgi:hypothetical protein